MDMQTNKQISVKDSKKHIQIVAIIREWNIFRSFFFLCSLAIYQKLFVFDDCGRVKIT